jgi:hypothetical protein
MTGLFAKSNPNWPEQPRANDGRWTTGSEEGDKQVVRQAFGSKIARVLPKLKPEHRDLLINHAINIAAHAAHIGLAALAPKPLAMAGHVATNVARRYAQRAQQAPLGYNPGRTIDLGTHEYAHVGKAYHERPGVGLAGIRGKRTTTRGYHVRGQGGAGRAGRAANYNRLGNYVMKASLTPFQQGEPLPYPGQGMKSGEPLVRALQSSLDRYHRMGLKTEEHGSTNPIAGGLDARVGPANLTGAALHAMRLTKKTADGKAFYSRLYKFQYGRK